MYYSFVDIDIWVVDFFEFEFVYQVIVYFFVVDVCVQLGGVEWGDVVGKIFLYEVVV